MLASSSPNQRNTQSMGLKIELSNHSHDTAASATGVVHGNSTQKRTSHFPLKSFTRTVASTWAIKMISAIDITVNVIVFLQAVQNTREPRIVRHWRSPTKSRLGFPVVTSLKLNTMASTNGNATRPMMYATVGSRKS